MASAASGKSVPSNANEGRAQTLIETLMSLRVFFSNFRYVCNRLSFFFLLLICLLVFFFCLFSIVLFLPPLFLFFLAPHFSFCLDLIFRRFSFRGIARQGAFRNMLFYYYITASIIAKQKITVLYLIATQIILIINYSHPNSHFPPEMYK